MKYQNGMKRHQYGGEIIDEKQWRSMAAMKSSNENGGGVSKMK